MQLFHRIGYKAQTSAASFVHSMSVRIYSSLPSSTGVSGDQIVKEENVDTGTSWRHASGDSLCWESSSAESAPSSIVASSSNSRARADLRVVRRELADFELAADGGSKKPLVPLPLVTVLLREGACNTSPPYPSGSFTACPTTRLPLNAATNFGFELFAGSSSGLGWVSAPTVSVTSNRSVASTAVTDVATLL